MGLHKKKKLLHNKGNKSQKTTDNIKQESKDNRQYWGEIFANLIYDKGLITNKHHELKQLYIKKKISSD